MVPVASPLSSFKNAEGSNYVGHPSLRLPLSRDLDCYPTLTKQEYAENPIFAAEECKGLQKGSKEYVRESSVCYGQYRQR